MSGKKTAVFGIYSSLASADSATDTLVRSGFPAADISALLPENLGSRQIGTEKATKAPEGAATGAGSGAVLGGALGLLAGIGALAIPGVGPLIAAGPIMAALAGVGVGGAVGGFTGALIGLGIPEYEAKRYEGRIEKNLDAALIQNRLSKHVKYDVKNGVVTLKGEVNSPARRAYAQHVAATVPNVRQVVNELQVKNQKASSTN